MTDFIIKCMIMTFFLVMIMTLGASKLMQKHTVCKSNKGLMNPTLLSKNNPTLLSVNSISVAIMA